jgi:HemK-related putative methylase
MKIEHCSGVYEPEDDSYLMMGIEEIRGRVLEIGCGTGIVGLSYADAGAKVTMVDSSEKATLCARLNALRNGISVNVVRTDLFEGIRGRFDYCIFNPPYLPTGSPDDHSWTGGKAGNEITIRFLSGFNKFSKYAFYIESTLSPINRNMFSGLKFEVVRKIDYEFEGLSLVKVTSSALYR